MPESSSLPLAAWSTSGGTNTRAGRSPVPVQPQARPVRILPAEGAIQASVVFDPSGRAFLADMAGTIRAVAPDGQPTWVRRVDGVAATPAVNLAAGRLFVGTLTGRVLALDTGQGKTIWTRELPTKSDARILSDLLYVPQQDAVVLSSWGGRFVCLDAATGEERHSWDAGISPYAGAAADGGGTVYCVRVVWDEGVELVRVEASGRESILCREPLQERRANRILAAAAPVLDEERGLIYFVANRDRTAALIAWSLKAGEMRWRVELPHCVVATPLLAGDDAIVVADLAGWVEARSVSGERRHRYASGSEYLLAGAVGDSVGNAFIGDPLGCLHAIGPDGRGEILFEAPRSLQGRASIAPDGRLWVPCTDGNVYVM